METFYLLSLLCILASLLFTHLYVRPRFCSNNVQSEEGDDEGWDEFLEDIDQTIHSLHTMEADDSDVEMSPAEAFDNLRLRFLTAYTLVVGADWLQVRFPPLAATDISSLTHPSRQNVWSRVTRSADH